MGYLRELGRNGSPGHQGIQRRQGGREGIDATRMGPRGPERERVPGAPVPTGRRFSRRERVGPRKDTGRGDRGHCGDGDSSRAMRSRVWLSTQERDAGDKEVREKDEQRMPHKLGRGGGREEAGGGPGARG